MMLVDDNPRIPSLYMSWQDNKAGKLILGVEKTGIKSMFIGEI